MPPHDLSSHGTSCNGIVPNLVYGDFRLYGMVSSPTNSMGVGDYDLDARLRAGLEHEEADNGMLNTILA